MPSPFPGMDPYLENPVYWPSFHHDLISQIKGDLTERLRPRYYARAEERVYLSDEDDPGRTAIVPDVKISEGQRGQGGGFMNYEPEGGVAIAVPYVLTTLLQEEIHEARVEIRDSRDRSVVTVIEVVSPTNKIQGAQGHRSYKQKRKEVMNSDTHWMEIDLLRTGASLVARERLPQGDYFIHLSRAGRRPGGLVWAVLLTEQLPVVAVPLKGDDPDTHLDLQKIVDASYDAGAFELDVDYGEDPVPSLSPDSAEWARALLKDKGLR